MSLENKSTRAVERELEERSSSVALPLFDSTEPETVFAKFEVQLNSSSQELLTEFRNLYGNQLNDLSDGAVLSFLLDKAVHHKKKELGLISKKTTMDIQTQTKAPRASDQTLSPSAKAAHTSPGESNPSTKEQNQTGRLKSANQNPSLPAQKAARAPVRRPLDVSTKRQLWKRAEGCCEFRQYGGGQRCRSRFALQPDHIVPVALGGTNELGNLQLLCRAHNQRRAVKTFGPFRS